MLKETERYDDLLTHELKIIQSDDVFSFSLDAVLLARFCSVPLRGSIVDLCSGNGVIPMLLTTRTRASIVGVEVQERLWDMAARSVAHNGLGDQIRMELADLREWARSAARQGSFDLVTVNPPYLPIPQGHQNENTHVAIARHEVMCTLDEVVQAASRLTRPGGRVAMVHRPARLADIMETMRRHRLEPKRIRFVHPRSSAESNMVLIEALRDGKPEVRLLPPLIVYKDDGIYCDELLEVYYGRTSELIGGKRDGCE